MSNTKDFKRENNYFIFPYFCSKILNLDDLELRVLDKTILHYKSDEWEFEFFNNENEVLILLAIPNDKYLELNLILKKDILLWDKLITEICEYLENNQDLKEYLENYHDTIPF